MDRRGRKHDFAGGSDRGQALVEAAMTLLAFLLFLFGIFEGGRLLQTQHVLTDAARGGARLSITPLTATSVLPTYTDVQNRVQWYLRAASLCTACNASDGVTITLNQSVVLTGPNEANNSTDQTLYSRVTVSMPYHVITIGMFGMLQITLTGQSLMRNETSPSPS